MSTKEISLKKRQEAIREIIESLLDQQTPNNFAKIQEKIDEYREYQHKLFSALEAQNNWLLKN